MNKKDYQIFDTIRFSDLAIKDDKAEKVIPPTQAKKINTKTPEEISYWINFGHFKD